MGGRKHDRVEVRTDPLFLHALDDRRRRQPDSPSRSEAIRRLAEMGFEHEAEQAASAARMRREPPGGAER